VRGVEPELTLVVDPEPQVLPRCYQRRGDAAPARAGVLELEELLSTHLNTRVKVSCKTEGAG